MNIHYFQHVPFEDLGSIKAWATHCGHRITATRFFAGDSLPSLEQIDWLIVLGGPMNVYEQDQFPWLTREKRFIEKAIQASKVVLGICLGAQLVADVLGARVYRNPAKEIGWFLIEKTEAAASSALFAAIPAKIEAFHWHGDTFELPAGAIHIARSEACENQAFVYAERVIGLQLHLEMTRQGAERLITHGAQEIVAGPFIQTAERMLSDASRFQKINEALDSLLTRLAT
jgi:GMP synthase (glutamine-hydrolysing)